MQESKDESQISSLINKDFLCHITYDAGHVKSTNSKLKANGDQEEQSTMRRNSTGMYEYRTDYAGTFNSQKTKKAKHAVGAVNVQHRRNQAPKLSPLNQHGVIIGNMLADEALMHNRTAKHFEPRRHGSVTFNLVMKNRQLYH